MRRMKVWRVTVGGGAVLAGGLAGGAFFAAALTPDDADLASQWLETSAQTQVPVPPRLGFVSPEGALPPDLLRPEGKTRWALTALGSASSGRAPALIPGPQPATPAAAALHPESGASSIVTRPLVLVGLGDLTDAAGAGGEEIWSHPERHRDLLRPGRISFLDLEERRGESTVRLFVRLETVGIGWLHLPSGPVEAALQRALVLAEDGARPGLTVSEMIHRWVDPRAGVLAEVRGPATGDGRERLGVTSIRIADVPLLSAMKIHVNELDTPPGFSVNFGWDRGEGTLISALTPEGHATAGALLADTTWDFTPNASGSEIASYGVVLGAGESCNLGRCGYVAGWDMSREDKNFEAPVTCNNPSGPERFFINTITQTEVRESPPGTPIDTTTWLRAGAINEGCTASSLVARDGESRLCFTDESGSGGLFRQPVPLWRFEKLDASGWYFDLASPRWSSNVFNCQQSIFNQNCGVNPSLGPGPLYLKNCTTSGQTRTGTQYGEPAAEGTVTLPSGHTFNALVVRNVADFCIYSSASCTGFLQPLDHARTVTYLWQVPHIGTVARLQSPQRSETGCPGGSDPDLCFTTVVETDFKFGLFPPLSITVAATRDTEVDLSWNPGNDIHRISGARIYWNTASGGSGPYAFSSVTHPGQVNFPTSTTSTVSGLTPGTTYYFSVTSTYTYTNPSTSVPTTYESLRYPTQVSGDPSFVYPVEVQAQTTGGTCIPTQEVLGVTVDLDAQERPVICWQPSTDPCLTGYDVLVSTDPASSSGNSTLGQTGLSNCFTGNAATGIFFYLTVTRGTGGTGPWGHYGL